VRTSVDTSHSAHYESFKAPNSLKALCSSLSRHRLPVPSRISDCVSFVCMTMLG
jgi:hypothetical protein